MKVNIESAFQLLTSLQVEDGEILARFYAPLQILLTNAQEIEHGIQGAFKG